MYTRSEITNMMYIKIFNTEDERCFYNKPCISIIRAYFVFFTEFQSIVGGFHRESHKAAYMSTVSF